MMNPVFIAPNDRTMEFPDVETALDGDEANGLLAVGGDLSCRRLLAAYQRGIFPWYSHGQPILWWSPDPRMVLFPHEFHCSRSLRKTIKRNHFQLTYDTSFKRVMQACAQPRINQPETWITNAMVQAYVQLHRDGFAHSFEAWSDGKLVGGLYGIAIGKVFFGESMFSFETNASKVTFSYAVSLLSDWGYELIDCQIASEHLARFGAKNISRQEFISHLNVKTCLPINQSAWNTVSNLSFEKMHER